MFNDVLWIIIELATNLYNSFLCIHFIIASFDNKCRILNVRKLHIIGTTIMTALVTLLNSITSYEGILGITYVLYFFLFACACLRGSILKKLFISVFRNICLICIAAAVGNVLFFFLQDNPQKIYSEHCIERFLYIIVSMALLTYVFAIFKKFTSKTNDSLKIKEWMLILSVLTVSFFIIAMIHIAVLSEVRGEAKLNLLMAAEFGVILINILCLYITVNLNETHKIEERLIIDRKHSEYSQQYAQTVKEQYEQTRRLRHDMKQYSAAMLALIRSGKTEAAEKLAEEQTDDLSKIETVINVDNDFLNAILNSKLSFARSKDIDVLCSIENDLSGIENTDLCNLMGNLLDNAVSAAEKCEPDSRLIEVNISSANSKLIIIIKNSICNSVLEENPKLKSTKQDASHHGYGVKTIHSIAEKYNGTVDFFEEGLMFICRVELQKEETIKK